ncbi:MAG: amidohydrolase family protein [Phycisphaeraceae bacterium]|nr:amidohydrolase family protein [Phycisphaeraceae bacterium]
MQPPTTPSAGAGSRTAANRYGLDYRREAERLGAPLVPIIDIHAHINGARASAIYRDVMDLYGIRCVVSQTRWEEAAPVSVVLGDRVRFVAIPSYDRQPRSEALGARFLDEIRRWHGEYGSRIVKLWAAPRLLELMPPEARSIAWLDSPQRRAAIELAHSLGMMVMVHVGDPDTWFRTKYADASLFKRKIDHYGPFERVLDDYPGLWMAAHMGGYPEDLDFLDGLLERHPRLVLDTSATKWIVREVSKHPRERVVAFLNRWSGRILFGSDIVTTDEHLAPKASPNPAKFFVDLASSPEQAFDLYASRYYALRTMWETSHDAESPIADPDLAMVEPERFDAMSGPRLRGLGLPAEMLRVLYQDASEASVWGYLEGRESAV